MDQATTMEFPRKAAAQRVFDGFSADVQDAVCAFEAKIGRALKQTEMLRVGWEMKPQGVTVTFQGGCCVEFDRKRKNVCVE